MIKPPVAAEIREAPTFEARDIPRRIIDVAHSKDGFRPSVRPDHPPPPFLSLDAVEALCGKSRHQTEASDDGDKYVCPIHHKTFMAKHRNCRQSERRYEASQTPTEQRAPPFDT